MNYKVLTLILSLFIVSNGWAKKIVDFEVSVKNNDSLFYGESVQLEFTNIYNNGKRKTFKNRHFRFLKAKVLNGSYENQKVYATLYPDRPNLKFVTVSFEYDSGNGILNKEFKIPLHFNGNLTLNFSGRHGESAKDKGSRVFGSVLTRDGRTGKDGFAGENGGNGNDILVSIWKDQNQSYRLKVTNLENGKLYHYKLQKFDWIKILSKGGNGGNGGDGGPGGDGKDGEVDDGKTKSPGDGGQGGNGGKGGDGGNGGNILVYVHPNAKEVMTKIKMENTGGSNGTGGAGGKGGDPGDPLEGQDAASSGASGQNGAQGQMGIPGEQAQIEIKNFTIKND